MHLPQPFVYSNGYIMLPVPMDPLPDTVVVEGVRLTRKTAFHVSLLCVKNILARAPHAENEIGDLFRTVAERSVIALSAYIPDFRLAVRDDRMSLIVRCTVSSLKWYFDLVSNRLGTQVPYQPTHVTLYTKEPDVGIGLNSYAELNEWTRRISVHEEIERAFRYAR